MTTPKAGAALRLRQMEDLYDRAVALKDYWMVRALIAEGHDLEPIPHPATSTRFRNVV